MKKLFALIMAVVMIAAMFCVPAAANDLIRVLMASDENVKVTESKWEDMARTADLDACLEKVDPEMIPEGCSARSGRITILGQGALSYSSDVYDVYDVTFKVWSTLNRTVCLFFRAEGEEEWQLVACNLGDVIEARFGDNGNYAIAVAW